MLGDVKAYMSSDTIAPDVVAANTIHALCSLCESSPNLPTLFLINLSIIVSAFIFWALPRTRPNMSETVRALSIRDFR